MLIHGNLVYALQKSQSFNMGFNVTDENREANN